MAVPVMVGVVTGLVALFCGGVLLLMVAAWWSWASDGIQMPRERWPIAVRAAALAGWGLFLGGMLVQIGAYFAHLGVARW